MKDNFHKIDETYKQFNLITVVLISNEGLVR